MFYLVRLFLLLMILFFFASCSEKISYSGKILNEGSFQYKELKNKEEILHNLGQPNFIDPIEKKYYYFSERKQIKNFFDQKITDRSMVVFIFNEDETVKLVSVYDLNDKKDIKFVEETTPNELIKRGWIEKIFGGVTNAVPNTTQ